MMRGYSLNKKGNKELTKKTNMIRKNYEHFNSDELDYLKKNIKAINLNKLNMSYHAIEKMLLNVYEIKDILRDKQYKIIDYNYHMDTKEERVLLRSKKAYTVRNEEGKIEKCYVKFVISLTNNIIVTQWVNRVADEENKQSNLKTRYISSFDIINKKIKLN